MKNEQVENNEMPGSHLSHHEGMKDRTLMEEKRERVFGNNKTEEKLFFYNYDRWPCQRNREARGWKETVHDAARLHLPSSLLIYFNVWLCKEYWHGFFAYAGKVYFAQNMDS